MAERQAAGDQLLRTEREMSMGYARATRAVIVLSHLSQQVCGHDHELVCPIVAQINFLAIQAAALLCVLLS